MSEEKVSNSGREEENERKARKRERGKRGRRKKSDEDEPSKRHAPHTQRSSSPARTTATSPLPNTSPLPLLPTLSHLTTLHPSHRSHSLDECRSALTDDQQRRGTKGGRDLARLGGWNGGNGRRLRGRGGGIRRRLRGGLLLRSLSRQCRSGRVREGKERGRTGSQPKDEGELSSDLPRREDEADPVRVRVVEHAHLCVRSAFKDVSEEGEGGDDERREVGRRTLQGSE
jgi:hypothetical protein